MGSLVLARNMFGRKRHCKRLIDEVDNLISIKVLSVILGTNLAMTPSTGNPHAAYDVSEAGDGVKGRTEAPEDGESLRPTATPRPCGHRASFRTYRRAATGNGAMAGSEAPALRKLPGTATPIRLPPPRQSPTLLHYYSKAYACTSYVYKSVISVSKRPSPQTEGRHQDRHGAGIWRPY